MAPYKLGEQLLLDCDQIIPIKEAEDYIIKVASKNRQEIDDQEELENRYKFRMNFWNQFLKEINKKNAICANISPTDQSWIGIARGLSGVSTNLVVSRSYARAEIYINRGSSVENKKIFDFFFSQKE